jgi:capsular polysaccharide transport system ATP-binding protein
MIVVEDVHKRYQTEHGAGKWVLQGVSLTIQPKVSVGLVGRNGAGKSTLAAPDRRSRYAEPGKIEAPLSSVVADGLWWGFARFPDGSAERQVRLPHSWSRSRYSRSSGLRGMDFSELGDAFDQPVKTYSSGMRSRLQFALSLAFDFDVYISDEVTAAGDASFRAKAAAAFKNMADRAGLIMVSHGEGTLRQFCSAGIWLHNGRALWFDRHRRCIEGLQGEYRRMLDRIRQSALPRFFGGVHGRLAPHLVRRRALRLALVAILMAIVYWGSHRLGSLRIPGRGSRG